MKRILLLVHFLVLGSSALFAQVNYSIISPASITMCGSRQTITVNISTATVVTNHAFTVDIDLAGLKIYNPRTTDGFQFTGFTDGDATLSVLSASLSANTSIQFDLFAGCDVKINTNTSLPANVEIKNSTNGLVAIQSLVVLPNQNGVLTPISNNIPSQAGNLGDLFVRRFEYSNFSSKPFSGLINFNDKFLAGLNTALDIVSIEIEFPDGSKQALINNVLTQLALDVNVGEKITIKEVVKVARCINASDQGTSNYTIQMVQSGCLVESSCNSYNTSTQIFNAGQAPIITRGSITRATPYYTCFDESAPQDVSFTFKNTGEAIADGLSFSYIPPAGYSTEVNSFIVEIIAADGTVKSFGSVLLNHPVLPGESNLYGVDQNNNEVGAFEYYRDVIKNPFRDFLAYTPSCDPDNFLLSRVISDYVDNLGNIHTIRLEANETVRINWRDKHCCSAANSFDGNRMSSAMFRAFLKDCTGQFREMSNTFGQWGNQFLQSVIPFNPTLNGNADKCMLTNDGETRVISIQNFQADTGVLPVDITTWGNLVVDLQFDNGVDLDITLNGTALPENYNGSCGAGNCFNSCSVQPMDINDLNRYHIQFIDDETGVVWTPTVDPVKINSSLSGSTYRTSFSYMSFQALLSQLNLALTQQGVYTLLARMRLEFKIRSVCPAPPITNIVEKLYYQANQSVCTSTCLMPLYSKDFKVVVVCPGCATPGGNLMSSVLERAPAFLGLIDANNDGVPDNNNLITDPMLKVNCTNGDELIGTATAFISDGDVLGYTLANLTAKNIFIDNLYLKIQPDDKGIGILLANNSTAEVSIDNVNWQTCSFTQTTGGEFIAKTSSSILGMANFNSFAGGNIYVRYRLNVIRENIINNPATDSRLIYVTAIAYFSDCDDCIDPTTKDWTFANANDGSNNSCDWANTSATCDIENKFYWCSSNVNVINYIPSLTAAWQSLTTVANSCNPRIDMSLGSQRRTKNSFPREYRSFIANGSKQVYTFPIPDGFRVSGLHINNNADGYYTVTKNVQDRFDLVSHQEILEAETNGLLKIKPNRDFEITLEYETLNQINAFIGNRYAVKYTGQKIRLADEPFSANVVLIFEPISCNEVVFESVYPASQNTAYPVVNPPYTKKGSTYVDLPTLPNTVQGTYTVDHYPLAIHKPVTKLDAVAPGAVSLDQNYFYIPIAIDNSAPLDASGLALKDITGYPMSSINANNPFLFLTNQAALAALGITVKGVYEGTVNSTNLASAGTDFYSPTTGIASLKKNNQNYIPANSRGNVYTMVVQYVCPLNCDPSLPSASSNDSELPACVKDPKQLFLQYGWNCTNYPQSATEIAEACETSTLAPVNLFTPSVALDIFPVINNNNPVSLCENFEYKLTLKSGKSGNINKADVVIDLPSNVEYVSSVLPAVLSGNKLTLSDVTGGGAFNSAAEKTIIIVLKLKSIINNSLSINTEVTSTSYCLSEFTRTKLATATVQSTIVGINATATYCSNATPVQITTTVAGGTFTLIPGLVDNGNGTAVFTPSFAGVGAHVITYTTAEGCTATKTITVIAVPVLTTNIPASFCVGASPFTLVSTPTGAVFTGSNVSFNTITNTYTFNASSAGTYSIDYMYTSAQSCIVSGQKTIQVANLAAQIAANTLSCVGESIVLTASAVGSSGGALTYTWYKLMGGVRQLPALFGPSASNTYTYANLTSATTFEVAVSELNGCITTATHTVSLDTPDACCTYKLGDISVACSTTRRNICVPLNAVRNVPSGIIGMDFCLKYNPAVMEYNGPLGNTTTSADLGPVVTRGGVAQYATYNDRVNGILRVSIYYTDPSTTATRQFNGIGNVICLNFAVLTSTVSGQTYPITMCNVNDLQEAYTLVEKAACWKAGSLTLTPFDNILGRLTNPLYDTPNQITGAGNTINQGSQTLIRAVADDCDLRNTTAGFPLVGNTFSAPMGSASKLKITRDIVFVNNASPSRARYMFAVNAADTRKMHRITTMDPILLTGTAASRVYWYTMVAADVNMNGAVRSNDITLIQERIVGRRVEFPQVWNSALSAPVPVSLDWRFVDQATINTNPSFKRSTVFPQPDATGFHRERVPTIPLCLDVQKQCEGSPRQEFYGVMLGDVERPSLGLGPNQPGLNPYLRTAASPSSLTVDVEHAQYLGNNIYRVPVIHAYNYQDYDHLFGIDMFMDYDQSKIRVKDVLYAASTTDAAVSMMWNNADEDQFILTSFTTLDSIQSKGVSYYLDIEKFTNAPFTKDDFGFLQFLLNGEPVEARITAENVVTGTTDGQMVIKPHITVIPNPAIGQSTIEFAVSNNSNNNRLVITDVLGRIVRTYEGIAEYGMLDLSTADLAPGMYICSIRGENGFVLTEKFQVRK